MIVGRHYCINEDHAANYHAIENAIRNTGYLPYELVHDRFPGHNYKPMAEFLELLEQWGVTLTVSSDPKSKAKLERWFGTLQTVFMQDSPFYYGQGIRSRRNYAHRSEEYMKKLRAAAKAEGWNWDAACDTADGIIDNYNATMYSQWSSKHKKVNQSPIELHDISEKPYTITLQSHEFTFLLGIREALPHTAGLIKKVLHGITYYYRITNYEIISKHSHILCCFDYNDMSTCELYALVVASATTQNTEASASRIHQYLGRVNQEVPANPYGPDAQWDIIAKRKQLIKETNEFRQQELEHRATGTDGNILDLLYPMTVNKPTHEAAETAYLVPVMANSPEGARYNSVGYSPTAEYDDEPDLTNFANQL